MLRKRRKTLFPVLHNDALRILSASYSLERVLSKFIQDMPSTAGFGDQHLVCVQKSPRMRSRPFPVFEVKCCIETTYVDPEDVLWYTGAYMTAVSDIARGPDDAKIKRIKERLQQEFGQLCPTTQL